MAFDEGTNWSAIDIAQQYTIGVYREMANFFELVHSGFHLKWAHSRREAARAASQRGGLGVLRRGLAKAERAGVIVVEAGERQRFGCEQMVQAITVGL
ncbi:hypothetical protein D3C77_719530 [compost metagenome]